MGSLQSRLRVWVVAIATAVPSFTHAQVGVSTGGAPEAPGDETEVGDTPDALPGVIRVGVPGVKAPRASTSVNLGYGFTEPQTGTDNAHHRLGGSLAAGIAPWSFAALAFRFDFRHDIHGTDPIANESDSGSVLDITPLLRVGAEVADGVHLGAEARLGLPGATVGDSGGPSPELDARALAAYSGLPTWLFALHAGYKMGHGGNVVTDAQNMRAGDRIALGVSEYDAILMGLGLVKTVGNTDILGEFTSEMLIGSGAPGFTESPLRVGAGIRHALARNLWLNGIVEAHVGGRAPSTRNDPLVPIEPRVRGLVGVTWRFWSPPEPRETEPEEEPIADEEPVEEPEEEAPPPIPMSTVRVTVVDSKDHPISDAEVIIEIPKSEENEGGERIAPLEDRNVYVLGDVPLGTVEVTVKAELLKPQTTSVEVKEGEPAELEVKLKPADTLGSQLRGLVRSYSGEGIEASVRVEPGDHSTMCQEDGSFELDLPPGVYKVIIEAEGYRSQRRSLRVRKEGVTVLNADLQEDANKDAN